MRFRVSFVDAQSLHAFMEVCALHSEGSGGGGDVPTDGFERLLDVVALGGVAGFMHRVARNCLPQFERNGGFADDVSLREDRHAFDNVAKLAGVAGPIVRLKCGQSSIVESTGAEIIPAAEVI